jgi:hypothetical protein
LQLVRLVERRARGGAKHGLGQRVCGVRHGCAAVCGVRREQTTAPSRATTERRVSGKRPAAERGERRSFRIPAVCGIKRQSMARGGYEYDSAQDVHQPPCNRSQSSLRIASDKLLSTGGGAVAELWPCAAGEPMQSAQRNMQAAAVGACRIRNDAQVGCSRCLQARAGGWDLAARSRLHGVVRIRLSSKLQ